MRPLPPAVRPSTWSLLPLQPLAGEPHILGIQLDSEPVPPVLTGDECDGAGPHERVEYQARPRRRLAAARDKGSRAGLVVCELHRAAVALPGLPAADADLLWAGGENRAADQLRWKARAMSSDASARNPPGIAGVLAERVSA